jgi:hypothetical protein
MPVAKTSIDLYGALAREVSYRRYRLEKSDVEQLLNYIKQELIISNRSSLIDAAYLSCRLFFSSNRVPVYKFEPSSFFISDSDRHTEIPAFDAWYIIILLSEYLSGAITEDIERLLPYFYGNYVPQNPRSSVFHKALQKIDAGIFECRKIMYSHYSSEIDATPKGLSSHDSVAVAHTKQADNHSAAVTEDVEREKEEIIDLARKQAEEERQRIINAANEEAVRIIQRASFEAEQKISTARKKIIETINNRGQSAIEAEQLQRGFSEVRSALLKANDMIKNLEDTVSESSIKKVSSQLLELFNLIADTKDSTVDLARKNNDQNLENTAYNMDVFLDMIIEYMAEYGIQSISSMPGDKFSPKYHTIGTGNQQFDPRSASIKVSKRTGFLWGEQVLQKEQVEI